ncbi:MAG: hypothetical protein ACJLS2_03540 [Microcella pacifica]
MRAIAQCISNVRRHAQTTHAEIVVGASPEELLGHGHRRGSRLRRRRSQRGRLGVGSSIIGRLDSIGGAATVWSQPGKGTSVMLRVPTGVPRR